MPSRAAHPQPTASRRLVASVVTALAVSALTLAATVLVYFVTNGAAAANLGPLVTYFLPATIALLALLFLASLLGAFRTWWGAALAGLGAGILGSVLGTVYTIGSTGTPWSQEVAHYLVGSLIGTSLVFEVAAVIAAITAGRAIWARLARGVERGAPIALVRFPSDRLAEGELTHLERTPVDLDLALAQWNSYVLTLESEGFEVVPVEPAEHHPDSVFIEDVVVMFGELAVVTRPGAQSRAGETEGVDELVASLGQRVERIVEPGTLDGGDVLKIGQTVYVGRGARTNAEGIRQLRALLAPLGYTVVAVPITRALHLKTAATALPDGTVVGSVEHLDSPAVFERFLPVPEPLGASVLVLAPDAVLMSSAAPETARLIEEIGYRVVTTDISEFEKLEGGVTCLSVRLR